MLNDRSVRADLVERSETKAHDERSERKVVAVVLWFKLYQRAAVITGRPSPGGASPGHAPKGLTPPWFNGIVGFI